MKPYEQVKGVVFDIQRYSVHDGPGIRTIVFLKGCPLRCLWCSNPESQRLEPEYMADVVKGGQKQVGKEMTVAEVMKQAVRDRVFYETSGGGITLSGGEPLFQSDFAAALIAAAKEEGIHSAVSTTGFSNFETLWKVVEHADYILYDVKNMDLKQHKADTGAPNDQILSNLKELAARGKEILVRVPLIPEHNANVKNLQMLCDFAAKIGIRNIEILPYHNFGESKYERLSRKYVLSDLKTQSHEEIKDLLSKLSVPESVNVIFE